MRENGTPEHLGSGQHQKKLSWADGTLDSWNYDFIDWLRDDPTTASPTSTTKDISRNSEAGSSPNHTVSEDGTFTLAEVGVVKILPKEPCWIVQRKDTGDK
jgi:hypothetical protein